MIFKKIAYTFLLVAALPATGLAQQERGESTNYKEETVGKWQLEYQDVKYPGEEKTKKRFLAITHGVHNKDKTLLLRYGSIGRYGCDRANYNFSLLIPKDTFEMFTHGLGQSEWHFSNGKVINVAVEKTGIDKNIDGTNDLIHYWLPGTSKSMKVAMLGSDSVVVTKNEASAKFDLEDFSEAEKTLLGECNKYKS